MPEAFPSMSSTPRGRDALQQSSVSAVMEASSKTDSDLAGGVSGLTSVIADIPIRPCAVLAAAVL